MTGFIGCHLLFLTCDSAALLFLGLHGSDVENTSFYWQCEISLLKMQLLEIVFFFEGGELLSPLPPSPHPPLHFEADAIYLPVIKRISWL